MQPISVQTTPSPGGSWYPSMIMDYEEGEWISIGVPMSGGAEVPLRTGATVHLQLVRSDGLRRFQSVVRGRSGGEGTAPHVTLDWPRDVEKIQRRDNVRVDAAYPVRLRVRSADESLAEEMSGMTVDLSAGGVRVRMPAEVPDHATVEIRIQFPFGERTCGARVVRGGDLPHARSELRHWLALELTDVDPAARRDITRFIFDLQRELLRRDVR